ncbi:MAG: hypothetical protein N2C12_10290, partial [Planctomycetales bacterium]
DGVTVAEALLDLAPILQLAADEDDNVAKTLKAFGLKVIGAAGARCILDGSVLRAGGFLSVPEPRQGLIALLDQPKLSPEPPPWAPTDIVGYSQSSADLGAIYSKAKEIVLETYGDQAATGFKAVEDKVNELTGSDLTTVLSSLGDRHTILQFEPVQDEDKADELPFAMQQSQEAMAFVWEVKDEAIWNKLIESVAEFAEQPNSPLKRTDEQGFNGWRVNYFFMEGGFVVGKGFLVIGYGKGVLERTLATLRNFPTGEDALRESKLYSQVDAMLDIPDAQHFMIEDASRYLKMAGQAAKQMLDQAKRSARYGGESAKQIVQQMEEFQAVVPSDEELEDTLGAAGGYAVVNDDGVVIKYAIELPAP